MQGITDRYAVPDNRYPLAEDFTSVSDTCSQVELLPTVFHSIFHLRNDSTVNQGCSRPLS